MARRGVDALIIGAGAAGLAAAREISNAGLTATVIEARGRIGGRIFTIHDANSPSPIELGAEFVHGQAPEMFTITRAAKSILDELPDAHFRSHAGRLSSISDFWGLVDEMRRDISVHVRRRQSDFSFNEYMDRARIRSDRRQMLLNFVEGYHAAYPDKISARSLAAGDEETSESGNKQFRVLNGYDSVLHWLRAGLDPERLEIRLNTIAIEARWKRGEVRLQCANSAGAVLEPFHAKSALITIPLALQKAKTLRFHPEIPEKEGAASRLEVGQVFKIVLRFRHSFWEEDDFLKSRLRGRADSGGLNFVHADDAGVPVWWTALPARVPLLTGWAGGPKAELLLNESEQTRVERTLDVLTRVLAVPRRLVDELLESWSLHDWRADPFSRGAYSYVGVGASGAQKTLAMPVEGTLFFGGEATDSDQTGTVAGAIASGRRAAHQLLRVRRA